MHDPCMHARHENNTSCRRLLIQRQWWGHTRLCASHYFGRIEQPAQAYKTSSSTAERVAVISVQRSRVVQACAVYQATGEPSSAALMNRWCRDVFCVFCYHCRRRRHPIRYTRPPTAAQERQRQKKWTCSRLLQPSDVEPQPRLPPRTRHRCCARTCTCARIGSHRAESWDRPGLSFCPSFDCLCPLFVLHSLPLVWRAAQGRQAWPAPLDDSNSRRRNCQRLRHHLWRLTADSATAWQSRSSSAAGVSLLFRFDRFHRRFPHCQLMQWKSWLFLFHYSHL